VDPHALYIIHAVLAPRGYMSPRLLRLYSPFVLVPLVSLNDGKIHVSRYVECRWRNDAWRRRLVAECGIGLCLGGSITSQFRLGAVDVGDDSLVARPRRFALREMGRRELKNTIKTTKTARLSQPRPSPPNHASGTEKVASEAKYDDYRWIVAIETADAHGDLDALADLLRSDYPLSRSVREVLADLFAYRRLNVPRKSGSDPEKTKLLSAAHVYKIGKRHPSERRDDRIARVAREEGVSEVSLRNLLDHRGRLSRRLACRGRRPTV
jgi:hypothetical protein